MIYIQTVDIKCFYSNLFIHYVVKFYKTIKDPENSCTYWWHFSIFPSMCTGVIPAIFRLLGNIPLMIYQFINSTSNGTNTYVVKGY